MEEQERRIHWIFLFCTFFLLGKHKNASHTPERTMCPYMYGLDWRMWVKEVELRWVKSDNNKICASFKWITGKNWQWQSRTWFIRLKDQMNGNTLVRSSVRSFTLCPMRMRMCDRAWSHIRTYIASSQPLHLTDDENLHNSSIPTIAAAHTHLEMIERQKKHDYLFAGN